MKRILFTFGIASILFILSTSVFSQENPAISFGTAGAKITIQSDAEFTRTNVLLSTIGNATFFAQTFKYKETNRTITGIRLNENATQFYYLSSGGHDYTGSSSGSLGYIKLKKTSGKTSFKYKLDGKGALSKGSAPKYEITSYALKIGGTSVGTVKFTTLIWQGHKFGFATFSYNNTTRYIAGRVYSDSNKLMFKGVYIDSNGDNRYFGLESSDSGKTFSGATIKEGQTSRLSFSLTQTQSQAVADNKSDNLKSLQ